VWKKAGVHKQDRWHPSALSILWLGNDTEEIPGADSDSPLYDDAAYSRSSNNGRCRPGLSRDAGRNRRSFERSREPGDYVVDDLLWHD
jgi:hypothetical protein